MVPEVVSLVTVHVASTLPFVFEARTVTTKEAGDGDGIV
jgi:hypothetical protein